MNDIVDLPGATYNLWLMIGAPLLVVLLGVVGYLLHKKYRKNRYGNIGDIWGPITIYAAFFSFLPTMMVGVNMAEDWDNTARINVLEDRGYSNIDVVNNEFTASKDGEYVKGLFFKGEGDEHTVVILEGPDSGE